MADLKQRFGKHVAAHRKRRGLTQEALAGAAQLSIDMIKRLETGRVGASFDVISRLSEALGVDASELLAADRPNDRQSLDRLLFELSSMSDDEIDWITELIHTANRKP